MPVTSKPCYPPYTKACSCKGTSSGPRVYIQTKRKPECRNLEPENRNWIIATGYAPMVCDVCQEPWKGNEKPCAAQSR